MQTASQKLQASSNNAPTDAEAIEDSLIGLFSGLLDLAERSEEILGQEVQPTAGFTWKA